MRSHQYYTMIYLYTTAWEIVFRVCHDIYYIYCCIQLLLYTYNIIPRTS